MGSGPKLARASYFCGAMALGSSALVAACGDDPAQAGNGGGGGDSSALGATGGGGDAGSGGQATDAGGAAGAAGAGGEGGAPPVERRPVTVLLVLEGLRPELMTPQLMPHLDAIAKGGVVFGAHHGVLPSNRMAAAATLATGTRPGTHGLLGSSLYLPGSTAVASSLAAVDTQQPVDLEDRGTLESLQRSVEGGVLRRETLVGVASRYGLRTAVIGRRGPATLFDIERAGQVLDDDYVWPRALADRVQGLGLGLPRYATALFPDLAARLRPFAPSSETELAGLAATFSVDVGFLSFNPTPKVGIFVNPLAERLESVYADAAELELAALESIIDAGQTDLIVVWQREPGESALRYGPGSVPARTAARLADTWLGALDELLPTGSTVFVASDGGVSALSGDARQFPRWAVVRHPFEPKNYAWAPVQAAGGVPIDGAVRLADLLTRAGFSAYDGQDCLSGHAFTTYPNFLGVTDGLPLRCYDGAYSVTKSGEHTPPAFVPSEQGADAIIIASNGGSELLYVPSHSSALVERLVTFLHGRPEVGAIFAAERYGEIPGTLPLQKLGMSGDEPVDLLVTYAWNELDAVAYGAFAEAGRTTSNPADLGAECRVDRLCRTGLYCNTDLPLARCVFCPADRPEADPLCGMTGARVSNARAASAYVELGSKCETTRVCADDLECVLGICRDHGSKPPLSATAPEAGALLGSSYGAMAGIAIENGPTVGTSAPPLMVRDLNGTRGGGAPAELRAVLIARGPGIREGVVSELPSGLIDVAPTVLHALQPGLEAELGDFEGRVLLEAFRMGASRPKDLGERTVRAKVSGVTFFSPTRPSSTADSVVRSGTYQSAFRSRRVSQAGREYEYPVAAGATRDLDCKKGSDCASGVCGAQGVCLAPSCSDGVANGTETGIDCGGAVCGKCTSEGCASAAACASLSCVSSVCAAASCSDGVRNGNEVAVDCGGRCAPCGAGASCTSDADCASGACVAEVTRYTCR